MNISWCSCKKNEFLKLITLSVKSEKDLERSAADKRHIIVIQKIKKNFMNAWMDYKKAFDSVLQQL